MLRPLGHGVDVLRVSRLRRVFARFPAAFPARILSQAELVAFTAASDQPRFLAVRWALKEALYKALHPAYPGVSWNDVTVTKQNRKPCILIHADVSHDGYHLITSVMVCHDE